MRAVYCCCFNDFHAQHVLAWSVLLMPSVKKPVCLQTLFKDNEVEAFVILAQLCNDGWLPIQQLLPARSIRAWLKEYEPEAALHPPQALQVLSAKLSQQSLASGIFMLLHPSAVRSSHF